MASYDLHIVSFAVPYPPHYGGAMDVYERIRALSAAGVRICLHCFVYGQHMPQPVLEEYANRIEYYPRSLWPVLLTRGVPYGVTSRRQKRLLEMLQMDQAPVWFETVQTTGWLDQLQGRKLLLRAHNVEHQYYRQLSQHAKGLKSIIFAREAQCLEDYEKSVASRFNAVFCVSPEDVVWFNKLNPQTIYLPSFHGLSVSTSVPGQGTYILYQGDLSIEINQRAIYWIIEKWKDTGIPLVVAGKRGDAAFESKMTQNPNLRREIDVSQEQMDQLIRQAHIILVHSMHASGLKLKLFPALYHGRHVMVNAASLTNTVLDQSMVLYNEENFVTQLQVLFKTPFSQVHVDERKQLLSGQSHDTDKAQQIIQYL